MWTFLLPTYWFPNVCCCSLSQILITWSSLLVCYRLFGVHLHILFGCVCSYIVAFMFHNVGLFLCWELVTPHEKYMGCTVLSTADVVGCRRGCSRCKGMKLTWWGWWYKKDYCAHFRTGQITSQLSFAQLFLWPEWIRFLKVEDSELSYNNNNNNITTPGDKN
jgi:hypothetical protein